MDFSRMIRRNVSALFLLLIVVLSSFGNRSYADSLESEFGYLENFSDVYNLIKSKYVTKFESKQLIYSAIAGMVNELDPYSSILSRKELEKLELQSVGQYVGIGVMAQKSGDQIVVTQVFENSPAQKAGIKPGDIIISIEGNLLAEKKDEEISSLLSGAEGTLVGLGFAHPEEPDNLIKVKLKRELIKANSTECRVHESEITLVSIHQFLKHTAREIADCKTRHNNQSLIVDLRNNPGGLLISAVEAADLFVGLGDIVQVRDRENRIIERYIARAPVSEKPPLLIILINKYSASAAEILAGAIRDRKAGILVGEKSYGKGVVQSVFPVGDDLFVKITTAKYYTPSKISFDGIGIEPDVKVNDSLSAKRYSPEDKIFAEAVRLVRLKNRDR